MSAIDVQVSRSIPFCSRERNIKRQDEGDNLFRHRVMTSFASPLSIRDEPEMVGNAEQCRTSFKLVLFISRLR